MLHYAAFCPHPPLSIPAIGQANLAALHTTIKSFQKINADLLAAKPDVLLIIASRHQSNDTQLVINNAPKYFGSLENFGDLATELEFTSDAELLATLEEKIKNSPAESLVSYLAEEKIDYGATIPLYHLTKNLIGPKVVILCPPKRGPLDAQLALGKALQKILKESPRKIALIASGDLSHKLTADSPLGVSPRAKEFDHTLIQFLKHKKINDIINLDPALAESAEECGLSSLVLLLGLLYRVPYAPQVLSYEHPLGIGYLTLKMVLK